MVLFLQVAGRLVPMTVTLWNKIQAKMLPTPSKFHYLFNMRELSKVFQGIILATRDRYEPTSYTCMVHLHGPLAASSIKERRQGCVLACYSCIAHSLVAADTIIVMVSLLSYCLQVQHAQGQSKRHSETIWWCRDKPRGLPAGAVGA